MEFINLKIHTDYSLLEGVSKVEDYVKKAKEYNMKYIGISDTNMYSIMKMYNECQKENIDLIIGLEVFSYGIIENNIYSYNIYAKSYEGYKEIIKLNKLAYQKSESGRNILELQDIIDCKNIIVTVGGINSELFNIIKLEKYEEANNLIDIYKLKFSDFYLELVCFELEEKYFEKYVEIYKNKNVKMIPTNEVYYLNKEDNNLQKIVSAIRENQDMLNVKKYYKEKDLYFKNTEEILEKLKKLDVNIKKEIFFNLEKLVKDSVFKFDFSEKKLPSVKIDISEKEYLKKLVYKNFEKKYTNNKDEAIKRIEYELEIIDKMGFNGYFIIVEDIVRYARENNILVGPGRGSAAGSIVAYLLDITKADPIKYELMFERFLNAGRHNLPDIDIDFETTKREEIIKYLMNKYGEEYVSNIITFSTLKEKQLKRDLCRVFKCKENDRRLEKIIMKLKNNVRHTSIHASGVIISKNKLEDEVPIINSNGMNIVQYQMSELEKMGLLKMDFLALSNLDVLAEVSKKTNINIYDIELNDKKTFEMYNKGNTVGIFQAESYGITELIKKYRIDKFTDISSVLALYRPGPLKSGLIDKVIKVKNNNIAIEYLFEELKEILESTYGLITYQEQVMKIAEKIAGFDLNESDDLRRAMSKKKADILKFYKNKFITRSINRNYEKEKIEILYSQIENFCEYGFNKSHTIPYAMISYYTAYFKANYTKEYLCSLLNEQITMHNKILLYFNEMEKFNIKMLPACVNYSGINFEIEKNSIRYGIYAINSITKSFAQDMVEERIKNGLFKNIIDFTVRMLKYNISKRQFENLAKSGSFDIFNISRKEIVENIDEIFSIASKKIEDNNNIGRKLFFGIEKKELEYPIKSIEEYSRNLKNKYEFETTGLLLSIEKYELLKVIKNKVCLVIDNNKIIKDGYILEFENNKGIFFEYAIYINKDNIITLNEIEKSKKVKTSILLDDLTKEKKEKLKKYIIKNGGFSKIDFYENKSKLISKRNNYILINNNTVKEIINIISIKNLSIKVEN